MEADDTRAAETTTAEAVITEDAGVAVEAVAGAAQEAAVRPRTSIKSLPT